MNQPPGTDPPAAPPPPDVGALAARVADAYETSRHATGPHDPSPDTACADALTEAADVVFGARTPEATTFRGLAVRFRSFAGSGAELAAGHLEQFGPHAPPGRVAYVTAHVRLLADVLTASGVDLLDDGRTVAELNAYADVFAAHPLHDAAPASRGPRPDPRTLGGALNLLLPDFVEDLLDRAAGDSPPAHRPAGHPHPGPSATTPPREGQDR
ncbi:hypothetical protein [Saccharothrix sp. HUAS TT1]|uniref:hypothetical protein n=1 Tax=unclassified Saccharothrix TaxID=2593673 RepID=UPI00345B7C74